MMAHLSDGPCAVRNLHLRLADRVPHQLHAIAVVAQHLRVTGAGPADPGRPRAAFLFVGAPDAGQHEIALALADLLCGSPLTAIDMRAYRRAHDVAALHAALALAVARNPCGVVLLESIDRAHPDALALFLRMAGSAGLADARLGRSIFIATASAPCGAALQACPDTLRIVPFDAAAPHHPSQHRQPKETSCSTSTSFSYPSASPRSAARI